MDAVSLTMLLNNFTITSHDGLAKFSKEKEGGGGLLIKKTSYKDNKIIES